MTIKAIPKISMMYPAVFSVFRAFSGFMGKDDSPHVLKVL